MNKKIVLIIGGSGGIGSAATRCLLQDGAFVYSTYFRNKEPIERLREEFGNDCITFQQCDARQEREVKATIDKVLEEYNKIDVVVFALTTPLRHKRILDLEWSDVYEHLEPQLKGMLFVMKSLREQIRSKHKTKFIVILTESCMGSPPKGFAHYVTSKYGAMGLSKAMAVELAQYGCTVNMICPGMVDTNLLKHLPPKLIEITAQQNPLKRIADPEDVANVVSFLASDKSDYLNGVSIPVNGGGVIQ
jgi:NAD(P)-dependent dehydrogenase (short-subunit alcohol dehydrogenase family)